MPNPLIDTDDDNAAIPCIGLRPEAAAAALGISRRTLFTWTERGDVPHARIGGVLLYSADGLRDWLAARVAETAEK